MERIIGYVQQQWRYQTLYSMNSVPHSWSWWSTRRALSAQQGRLEAELKWRPYLRETRCARGLLVTCVSPGVSKSHPGHTFCMWRGGRCEERGLAAPVPGGEQKLPRNLFSFSSLLHQAEVSRACQGISSLQLLSKLGCVYMHGEFEVNLTSNSCSPCHIHLLLEHLEQMIWLV